MATYAQVENDIVINVIVADAEWIAEQSGEWILYTEANPCIIGCDVVNGVCVITPTPPPFPIPPVE